MISIDKLKRYCEEKGIAIPSSASRDQIEASIARSYLHMSEVKPHKEFGCFGLYSHEDMNCERYCGHSEECFKVSFGTTEEKLERFEKRVRNVSFSEPKRKGRR